jgi:glucosamine-6-phosphate deaminase
MKDMMVEEPILCQKIPARIYENTIAASIAVAGEMAALIKAKKINGEYCVMGLATGSTPKLVYKELVRMHKEEGLSFKNVISFNLDEYYPMEPDSLQSYVRFMNEHLFDHVDIERKNIHIPDGTLPLEKIKQFCSDYDKKINEAGGIDFQLLGIGGNGHIGFNEPGSLKNAVTRLMMLDQSTRAAAASDFGGQLVKVPRKAITLGVEKILEAKRIVLLAWGENKASIVKVTVEGQVTENVPASYLQLHNNAEVILDEGAASELTHVKSPWLFENVIWDIDLIKKAVTNLSLSLNKSILKLTNKDYNDNGLSDLLAGYGKAYDINIKIFNLLQHTITGWPGGKPNAEDIFRPERAMPEKKRCLIFSPHPDDDIISMGGTFQRLVDQGHEVHVAYQTSGNIAVADDDALRFIDFVVDFNDKFGFDNASTILLYKQAKTFILNKKDSDIDTAQLRYVKGLIRRGEAKATCRFVGIAEANVHFLDMPFYETGRVEKNALNAKDIAIVADIIKIVRPHQIFAAGDLADPHGTHKVCLDAVFAAVKKMEQEDFMQDCWVWLYRGAWAEWEIHQIEMAVPLSPEQVLQKRLGIFKHQSQKDGVVFQGTDAREFWQRAEERNKATAGLYNKLGFAEYEAMEAFVRWKP